MATTQERLTQMGRAYWSLRTSELFRYVAQSWRGRREWRSGKLSVAERFLTLWDMLPPGAPGADELLDSAWAHLLSIVDSTNLGATDLSGIVARRLRPGPRSLAIDDPSITFLCRAAMSDLHCGSIQGFTAFLDLRDEFPSLVADSKLEELSDAFHEFAAPEEEAILSEADFDSKLSWFEDLSEVARRLDVGLRISEDDLGVDPRDWEYEDDGWRDGGHRTDPSQLAPSELDRMFGSLSS